MHKVQKTIWEAWLWQSLHGIDAWGSLIVSWRRTKTFLSFWQNVGLDTKWYALGQGTLSDGGPWRGLH
jgi:hypothetical protein